MVEKPREINIPDFMKSGMLWCSVESVHGGSWWAAEESLRLPSAERMTMMTSVFCDGKAT